LTTATHWPRLDDRTRSRPSGTLPRSPAQGKRPLLRRVPQHRTEVTGRAHQNEHVPDEMTVAHAVRGIEGNACGIGQAAGEEPQPARRWHVKPQRDESRSAPASPCRRTARSTTEGSGCRRPPPSSGGQHEERRRHDRGEHTQAVAHQFAISSPTEGPCLEVETSSPTCGLHGFMATLIRLSGVNRGLCVCWYSTRST
jgi:hypothetical protein